MSSSFRLTGIDPTLFDALFALSDQQLASHGALRCRADKVGSFPCRVSLEDAAIGAMLLLIPYRHQPAASPYRASGPIFVRQHAASRVLDPGVVPPYVTNRLISLRAYDDTHLMIDASVEDGPDVAMALERLFDDRCVDYVHLHNAKPGCYSCRADRA